MKIQSLYRYPIKGFTPENLTSIKLTKDAGFLFDRYWAVESGTQNFVANDPVYLKKGHFIQLLSHPKLALLQCKFECEESQLSIFIDGHKSGQFNLSTKEGKTQFERFLVEYLDHENTPDLSLVNAPNHHFSDIPEPAISLINLASVSALSSVLNQPVDPLRFRANIYIEGLEPWQELDWVGKSIWHNDEKIFDVFADTGRCLATHVNLNTGERDLAIKNTLLQTYDHSKCGVYIMATSNTTIEPKMVLTIK